MPPFSLAVCYQTGVRASVIIFSGVGRFPSAGSAAVSIGKEPTVWEVTVFDAVSRLRGRVRR